ncbi:dehydration-responsive element-binding protein 1D-like [Papaver somniferum]|uniref:dehydration-responsive element-binding protein 1D-like n=1 Tax=Papaver somniferum TaxID=3469 RepID=UPI000E6FC1AF|nr:dehydration-responsive element-binding protein 1D-like [Papaver somniferum]
MNLGNLHEYSSSSDMEETLQNSVSAQPSVSHKKKAGRKKFKETRHPTYRGVRERKNDKWVCEIREPNSKSRIWLGTHSTPEMAARAHDVAALALRGDLAPLNFEDSLWLLHRAKSSSRKDIQCAAAEAAHAFPLRCYPKPSSIPNKWPHGVTSRLSRLVEEAEKASNNSSSPATFYDDEALYYMPALIASMAEGMLLDPPQEGYYFGDVDCNMNSGLWTDTS